MNDKHEATTERCETGAVSRVGLLYRKNIHISHQGTHQTSRLMFLPKLYSGPCFRGTLKIHMNKKHEVKTERVRPRLSLQWGFCMGRIFTFHTRQHIRLASC